MMSVTKEQRRNRGSTLKKAHRSDSLLAGRFTASLLAILLIFACPPARAQGAVPPTMVGSNFFWYHIDQDQCAAGHPAVARDSYPVISGYGTPAGRLAIDATLQSMRQSGQRAIAVGLFHEHGAPDKFILNSAGGKLSPAARSSLSALIDTLVRLDFRLLYLRFFPAGSNFVPVTSDQALSLEPELYQENLSFIEDVLQLADNKKIALLTDLCNECSPSSSGFDDPKGRLQARLMVYTRQLWKDYVRIDGPDRTVGFSIIPDKFRIAELPMVYGQGGVHPKLLDMHFYASRAQMEILRCKANPTERKCETVNACEHSPRLEACQPLFAGSVFDGVATQLASIGFNMPWVAGETFYNDPESAAYLKAGMALTHHPIKYIFQWPLRRPTGDGKPEDACANSRIGGGVNVEAPTDADAYLKIK